MRLVANKRSNQRSLRPCRAWENNSHEGVLQGHVTRVTPTTIKLRVKRFSKGNFIGTSVQRCRTVLSCTKRATFLFPEPHSAVGSEFHVRLTRDRDNDDEAPRGFSGGGIGGTTLRLFTVGRIMCETGYFPVSQATFGCWVKISQETYTGPGQHLRAGITTGHPRQRWERMGVRENGCFS